MNPRQTLLILRPDNVGDGILFSGAMRHVRAHWPEHRIDLMVQPSVGELYKHCPFVDRILPVNRLTPWEGLRERGWPGTWRLERAMLRDWARACWYPKYDVVLYPLAAPTELYLRAVRLLEANEKIGYGGDQLRLGDMEDVANRPEAVFTRCYVNRPEDRWLHDQERTRRFLGWLGMATEALSPELWLTSQDRHAAEVLVPDRSALGCFVGASSVRRQWPVEKWVELVRRQDVSKVVVLLGGCGDRAVARTIRESLKTSGLDVRDMTGRARLRETAAIIERCAAVVSNDSGGIHMAVAAGVPAVCLLGGYHFGRFYPWGDPGIHRVANLPMDCYHCNDDCRYGDWRCVSEISVATALQAMAAATHERIMR